MRSSLRALSAICLHVLGGSAVAQLTPAAVATKLADSLVFVGTNATTNSSLVWHPVRQRYYGLRPGLSAYPLETWLVTGGLSVAQTTCGMDTRGMWYNPSTGNIERNGFNANGWATMDIDVSSNAMNTFTVLFAGQNQPNIQSFGILDPSTNSVLFYESGSLRVYSRATATLTATIPLTGVSLANVATYTVLYSGQTGYELMLYDVVLKRILFFNRTTGAFSGQCDLPASAAPVLTGNSFRLSYTNGRFWVFNSTLRKWNAYCIWQQQCPSFLPVELLDFQGGCSAGEPTLTWSTGSEHNSSHFIIERSTDLGYWEMVDRVPAAGTAIMLTEYGWSDTDPVDAPLSYYRLRQVDLDGRYELFHTVGVERCVAEAVELEAYPNPVTDVLRVSVPFGVEGPVIELFDAQGRLLRTIPLTAAEQEQNIQVDVRGMSRGTYSLQVRTGSGEVLGRTKVIKE